MPETKFFQVVPSLKSVFEDTVKPFSLFGSNTNASEGPATHDADDDDDNDDDNDDNDDDLYESDTEDTGMTFKQCKSSLRCK